MKDAPEDNPSEIDIQALVSRWADETGRLFRVLPTYLSECEERKVELQQLRQQVAELKQENEKLRQSQAALADLYTRFKQLVEGSASPNGAGELRAPVHEEPSVPAPPTTEGGIRLSSVFSRAGHKA